MVVDLAPQFALQIDGNGLNLLFFVQSPLLTSRLYQQSLVSDDSLLNDVRGEVVHLTDSLHLCLSIATVVIEFEVVIVQSDPLVTFDSWRKMQVVTVVVCVYVQMFVATFLAEIVEVFVYLNFQRFFKLLAYYCFLAFLI